jgi:hypothetical protein
MILRSNVVLAIAACLSLASCIQYVKGDLPEPPELAPPPATSTKLSATYELSLGQLHVPEQGEPEEFARLQRGEFPPFEPGIEDAPSWLVGACREALRDTLARSGRFSTIEESVERGDVHFRITTAGHGSSFLHMSPAVWSLFAIVLPTWAAEDRIVHVEVLQNQREPWSYDLNTTVMTWGWTPLMLAAPFQEKPPKRNVRIFRAAFGEMLQRMQANGAFAESARPTN